jgi:catechol 2,3-dioxygenase-like lactoylglutathione lyase family enzyme
MPTIVHFDIPAEDVERSQKFYTELFGWKIEKFSEDTPAGEYWMITITDDKGNKESRNLDCFMIYPLSIDLTPGRKITLIQLSIQDFLLR